MAPSCRPADLDAVRVALLPRGRPLLVHHWATWCAPCVDELPVLGELLADLGEAVEAVGICWDAFLAPAPPEQLAQRVGRWMAREELVALPTLVYTGSPEALFDALELPVHTVPQTRLVGADGALLHEVPGPLGPDDRAAILRALGR